MMDGDQPASQVPKLPLGRGIVGMDVTHQPAKEHLEKSLSALDKETHFQCAVCKEAVEASTQLVLVCPEKYCIAISHMTYLSNQSLQLTKLGESIPTTGSCPKCKADLKWIDLVK